jgi:DNA-binding transcriptional regulator YiaG
MESIKNARKEAGLTQAGMSELTKIPQRTIQEWEGGRRKCPPWAERLILKELAEIKEKQEK